MRIGSSTSSAVLSSLRVDSKFFLDAGQQAFLRITSGKWPLVTVGDVFGGDNVWMPSRFARVLAKSEEYGSPLLVPYDCFRYIPHSEDYLSRSQVAEYSTTHVVRGWLLIVRSGRNLGPVTIVDQFLEKFAISDDMIRLSASLSEELLYFYAVMSTDTGQALIRRDRNGSVIDHLGPKQVASLQYPMISAKLKRKTADAFERAMELREAARIEIASAAQQYSHHVGFSSKEILSRKDEACAYFSLNHSQIIDRFDAEPFSPRYAALERHIAGSKYCARIGDLAVVSKPPGRYRTNYLTSEAHGIHLLSGRQIAQYKPIALKLISPNVWDDPNAYTLQENMILLTADGRAGQNLADCVLVRANRAGWAASGHVIRLSMKGDTHAGLLYLACASAPIQAKLKSLATGSVVDALSERDVESVLVIYPRDETGRRLAQMVCEAWDKFAIAEDFERDAVGRLQAEFYA